MANNNAILDDDVLAIEKIRDKIKKLPA
jgi:hypothetical protein